MRRHKASQAFLEDWWRLADAAPDDGRNPLNPFRYDVREAWPWEQGPIHVAKERHKQFVQVGLRKNE